jgi:xanthine dehydrogenase YagR molybdenum-binding subunit
MTQTSTSPVGRDTVRVDGPRKVSGLAQYTSDFHFPDMLYAVPVEATIANGKLLKLDTSEAEKMPGVRAIFHRENIGQIFRSTFGPGFEGICIERRPPFEDDLIRYYGQYIAVAVADTFESAKGAADAVRATYAKEKPNVDTHLEADEDPDVVLTTYGPAERLQSQRGDAEKGFATAPIKLDQTYVTPAETHNPLELHATTAIWEGSNLTLYESSQAVVNLRGVLAPDVWVAEGEREGHYSLRGLGLWQQAVAMDSLFACGSGSAAVTEASQTSGEPQNDVSVSRSSTLNAAACAHRCDA